MGCWARCPKMCRQFAWKNKYWALVTGLFQIMSNLIIAFVFTAILMGMTGMTWANLSFPEFEGVNFGKNPPKAKFIVRTICVMGYAGGLMGMVLIYASCRPRPDIMRVWLIYVRINIVVGLIIFRVQITYDDNYYVEDMMDFFGMEVDRKSVISAVSAAVFVLAEGVSLITVRSVMRESLAVPSPRVWVSPISDPYGMQGIV